MLSHQCGSPMRILAFIDQPVVIDTIPTHRGL